MKAFEKIKLKIVQNKANEWMRGVGGGGTHTPRPLYRFSGAVGGSESKGLFLFSRHRTTDRGGGGGGEEERRRRRHPIHLTHHNKMTRQHQQQLYLYFLNFHWP
ncbi:hypothetical protein SAY87_004333 [Trapa incisa]|uniref:Uncharacterized protein n=1 Tax=Trapa incisa TaxID=236973 RepID=A0AAN7JNW3_9MYRT|nr:hypothetical protein SAY87_004333 [Trapa incisa]